MSLLDRLLMKLWDPNGERQRAQERRLRRAQRVFRNARQIAERADRVNVMRDTYQAADERLR